MVLRTDMLRHPTATLLLKDTPTMDTLRHPTATLPGKDTVIMDMLPWTDMLTMDTLHHPTATLPWTDMRIMDTRLPRTTTPQGSDTAWFGKWAPPS